MSARVVIEEGVDSTSVWSAGVRQVVATPSVSIEVNYSYGDGANALLALDGLVASVRGQIKATIEEDS